MRDERRAHASRKLALAKAATTLLVVLAAYTAGGAQDPAWRWVSVVLTLIGISLLWWLQRLRLRHDDRRDELVRVILDSIPHILFYKDAASRYIGINSVFERTFGIQLAGVVGKTDAQLFGQELHDRFVAQDRELLATGEARTFEEEMLIDGEIHYIESRKTPFYDAAGNAIGIVGLAMDVTETRRLRHQLEVGNARLSVALRAAQMGTWAWNPESDEFDLDAFEGGLFGVGEGRHKVSDLLAAGKIHPDDIESVRNAARKALKEGVASGYEFRTPGPDGKWRWVEGAAIRYSEPGKSSRLIGVNRDISERKQQELELAKAKQSAEQAVADLERSRIDLDLALQSGRLGVWHSEVRNPAAGAGLDSVALDEPVQWDANVRRIFGRDADEPVTRRQFFEALHPEDRNRVLESLSASGRGGRDYSDQYRIIRPNGEIRTIAVHATPLSKSSSEAGELRWMTGIARDITEEENLKSDLRQKVREAQQASRDLEKARAELELALRSGRLGVWRSDYRDVSEADRPGDPGLDDDISWDTGVRRIFGVSVEERVTRRYFFEALHPDDRERVLANLAEAAASGSYYTDRYRITRPDGELRWVEVQATLVSRPELEGRVQITGIARDITDEENLKEILRQKALEAQQAVDAKARFLAMMSHEIRTPLNGVVGMIELLTDTPMSPDQQQMLKSCKDSAFVLLTIINDILDFSKIEAGKLELDAVPLSLRRLVEGVGEALGTQASQRGIDLDVFVDHGVPRQVIGDQVRLRQILTNLIGNAVKFTERGGVSVDVSPDKDNASGNGMRVRFDIVDTGIGMDEGTVRSLFQAFQQADAATTRRFGGTGLGLSIVKHLTELMGGRVECESRQGHGSRFSVVIPFELAAAESQAENDSIAGARVLALVAREKRRRVVAELLAQSGATVEFQETGDALHARAVEASKADGFDVVLLDRDWSISERAGLRRRFAETPALAHLPFVAVRSYEPVQAQLIPDVILINGNPVTHTGLVHGIAVATGRTSPLVPTVAAPSPEREAGPVSREQEAAAGRLILLAEDHPTNREVISLQLARLGYACDIAEDGEQAWSLLQSGNVSYGLLLTDCHMPRLDGYQLTAKIRDQERESGAVLPIIAITANALQGERERCLALGMTDYLAKPLQLAELKRLLADFLPQRPAQPEGAGSSSGGALNPFPILADLLDGDEAKLRHVLEVFEHSTKKDCELLNAAYAAGDRQRVRGLAHKLKSGCRQLGDETAALALEAVERTAFHDTDRDASFDEGFLVARNALVRLLAGVGDYLSRDRRETEKQKR